MCTTGIAVVCHHTQNCNPRHNRFPEQNPLQGMSYHMIYKGVDLELALGSDHILSGRMDDLDLKTNDKAQSNALLAVSAIEHGGCSAWFHKEMEMTFATHVLVSRLDRWDKNRHPVEAGTAWRNGESG